MHHNLMYNVHYNEFQQYDNITYNKSFANICKETVTNVHYVYGEKTDRQTNRNSNSVINDCTYIKTINILNTVGIYKKSSRMKWH